MRYKINLFPPKDKGLVDKVIYFAYNYLRYILVLTQLIVIYVFFYRFSVDQKIVDLKDTLNQKQEIVSVVSPLLTEASRVDLRIKNIDTILRQQDNYHQMVEYFLARFPADFSVTKLNITKSAVQFEGFTSDVNTVKLFYNKLKAEGKFKTVQLDNVSRIESGYKFSFRLLNFADT